MADTAAAPTITNATTTTPNDTDAKPKASPASALTLPPLTYTYRVHLLPTDSPNLAFLTGKFAALSLLALSTDPASFGMSYSTEATFTPADWHARITRPNVRIFALVAHPSTLPSQLHTIEHGAWVGMVTQIGPTPKSEFMLPVPGSGVDEPPGDDVEERWHQTGTWVDSAHRGKGLAGVLVEAGVEYARGRLADGKEGEKRKQARIRAFTGPKNKASMKLYGGKGFPAVGLVTIREAVKANGNGEWGFWGRWDWEDRLLDDRAGVVMERVVVVGQ